MAPQRFRGTVPGVWRSLLTVWPAERWGVRNGVTRRHPLTGDVLLVRPGGAGREIRAAAVDAQKMSDWLLARERDRAVEEEQPRDGPNAGKTTWTPGRDVALDRGDDAPVVPDARDGMMGQADESRGHVASQRLVVGDAQQAPSAPGDRASEDWSRSQDLGPGR